MFIEDPQDSSMDMILILHKGPARHRRSPRLNALARASFCVCVRWGAGVGGPASKQHRIGIVQCDRSGASVWARSVHAPTRWPLWPALVARPADGSRRRGAVARSRGAAAHRLQHPVVRDCQAPESPGALGHAEDAARPHRTARPHVHVVPQGATTRALHRLGARRNAPLTTAIRGSWLLRRSTAGGGVALPAHADGGARRRVCRDCAAAAWSVSRHCSVSSWICLRCCTYAALPSPSPNASRFARRGDTDGAYAIGGVRTSAKETQVWAG